MDKFTLKPPAWPTLTVQTSSERAFNVPGLEEGAWVELVSSGHTEPEFSLECHPSCSTRFSSKARFSHRVQTLSSVAHVGQVHTQADTHFQALMVNSPDLGSFLPDFQPLPSGA